MLKENNAETLEEYLLKECARMKGAFPRACFIESQLGNEKLSLDYVDPLKSIEQWVKFFLTYTRPKQSEEEMLILILQYLFRMIWIEENESYDGYESTNVNWLTKEHFKRIEAILDTIVNEIKNVSVSPPSHSCINYSIRHRLPYSTDYCKGQHWNISDTNYVAMLETFLRNIYNTAETNKDVVIWCYISNLPLVEQGKDTLYEYLRFVKKLLNNNRESCDQAMMQRGDWSPENNHILYVRYYVQGIPQYYTQCQNEECNSETFSFLDSIITLNKGFVSNVSTLCTDSFKKECKNDLCKGILSKEIKKQNSPDKNTIQEYENLSFANGLVDNFLIYTEETCYLKEFCDYMFYSKISSICPKDV